MKCIAKIILFTALLFQLSSLYAQELTNYQLGPDDKVNISIFNEPDLGINNAKISVNGTVSLPLIGQVKIAGLTTEQTEQRLIGIYQDGYLKNPRVTVSIIEYRQFYINGEIKSPGGYHYREGLTIQKAISLAGGFTPRADKDKIKLIRENTNGKVVSVKLTDSVQPGDLITIDESFF
ncbi:polysaccharide export protein [Catenovulum sp. 2E275]|uniref:polysaccharide biosynthesis/export family protein n=1 Tax=Catenovulum sp. 2E275 TaxID=2980497 RepID=UPI0021CFA359|nr:polysaccharide biosynthesis/export family protein [Catenovulum sp. 2E275]MCU4674813.1 polysaccharide export protein [Catenovulum sp. 2E275]